MLRDCLLIGKALLFNEFRLRFAPLRQFPWGLSSTPFRFCVDYLSLQSASVAIIVHGSQFQRKLAAPAVHSQLSLARIDCA
jgi:hypothetical protein